MRTAVILLVCYQIAFGQTLNVHSTAPQTPPVPSQASPTLQHIASDSAAPKDEKADIPGRSSLFDFIAAYRIPTVPPLHVSPADRARSFIRDGVMYLSLYDAITLAIENNLDVEVARYNLSIAGTEVLRAKGGGDLRGIDYSVAESPTGVGGPGSPLLNSAASTVTPNTPTVNDLTSLNVLTETQTNLSVQGTSG